MSMSELIERLEKAGVPFGDLAKKAMLDIYPGDFTDYNIGPFWEDRPIPFLFTEYGSTRTISAPHMIGTLLHHLEVIEGQDILVLGSKGGYLSAIIDRMVGGDGSVTIIEPNREVRMHTEECITNHRKSGMMRVIGSIDDYEGVKSFERILITGSVREIPEGVEHLVIDGGFVLGPFGGPVHQRLLKTERQGEEWFDTDLGGVVFGPMEVSETEYGILDPNLLASHIEDALDLVESLVEIEEEASERIRNLIISLREMPTGLPLIDEDSTEEEVLEHPVVDLIMSEIDWLGPLWPIFSEFLSVDIANPGSPEDVFEFLGDHEDLVP